MLDERKAAVLRAVVEEYIATAQPVGSSHLAGRPGMVVSSATVQEMLPFGPGAWVHLHRHSLRSGSGGPLSFSERNFPPPVGAPTGSVVPLAVGLGTLHAAQALASHLLPMGACGLYGPNI